MRLQLHVTVDTNTLDIDDAPTSSDCQPTAQSARSLLRTVFGCISERAHPTGYEPNAREQFEDFTSHNFASIQGVSLTSLNAPSSGSMTEVGAPTITSAESFDLAPIIRSRQQERGHRFSPTEGWSSTEKRIPWNLRLQHKKEALHQQRERSELRMVRGNYLKWKRRNRLA